MKLFNILILLSLLFLAGCLQHSNSDSKLTDVDSTELTREKAEIQNLIRQVLNWSYSQKNIDILPVLTGNNDSVYMGFDLKKHKENLVKLSQTNFFSSEFLENYNQIILTLDKKLRNKEFEEWRVGELPTFIFANDVDPWCNCQDIPFDSPNPWDSVEVKAIKLDKEQGELTWRNPGWSEDSGNKFRVVKENGKWKIAYMEGFDFKEGTRKDGL